MVRNLPAVSSSISWSRKLYYHIEKPMNQLSTIKMVTESQVNQ